LTQSKARWNIIRIWSFGLLVNFVLVTIADFYFFGQGDDRAPIYALYGDVFEWYGVPLTAMFGAIAATKSRRSTEGGAAKADNLPVAPVAFRTAFAISVLWSVALIVQVFRITPFLQSVLTIQDLMDWIRQYVKWTGFLVTFVLSYFFAVTGGR
jgi:hypothetical protein